MIEGQRPDSPTAYENLIVSARTAADELLVRYLGISVNKALDLHTRSGFDRAVADLAAELRRQSQTTDRDALRLALHVLDVDWRRTSVTQRRELIARAMADAGRATRALPRQLAVTFGRRADQIVRATRQDVRERHRIRIGADFNAVDRRAIDFLVRSQALFVTDEYGRRRDDASGRAAAIVADGLERGLATDDIANDLRAELTPILVGRGSAYWHVVASVFTASSRSFSQVSAYAEASIERYRVSAVLDEATTDTCRFLDGKIFDVRATLGLLDRVAPLQEPANIKEAMPWIREGRDETTGRHRLFVGPEHARSVIADVERSGLGQRDDRGAFTSAMEAQQLEALGIGPPPYHARCRTTTVPVL